ncbi:MAG: ABC transporter ATP-binding protein [Spirochaetales bacterium]|nr:ABC transporter ATP-binding protein [Spirochaetales bacterium]
MDENIIEVRGLKTYYYTATKVIPAADDVTFSMKKGEVLGIVGESGCGKTTVARSLVRLINKNTARIEAGEILFDNMDLSKATPRELSHIRGNRISMIFQDPFVSLSPVYTVGNQIAEVMRAHSKEKIDRHEERRIIIDLMKKVGIPSPEMRIKDYPYQLSGGMQQRIMIAIALACRPDILIADEPTTALDVTVQAQVLELIRDLKDEFQMSVILISHNLGIVANMCDRILVMYGGAVVEEGSCYDIFKNPKHPYTRGLLKAIPSLSEDRDELFSIPGTVPTFTVPVTTCRFADRCPHATEQCRCAEPELRDVGPGHKARCVFADREWD